MLLVAVGVLGAASSRAATGDPEQGAQAFRACIACHSLEPGKHRTGPSLAGILGRKAGTAEGFRRYSPALKSADVLWNEASLDTWIADPRAFIPGNRMTFPGLPDAQARADLIAHLAKSHPEGEVGSGGMMDMGDLPTSRRWGPRAG